MSSPHSDPAANGTRFGQVVLTVDLALGDAVIRAPQPGPCGPIPRKVRFNSLDEIEGAYVTQAARASIDPVAEDIARALKFAADQIRQAQGSARHA